MVREEIEHLHDIQNTARTIQVLGHGSLHVQTDRSNTNCNCFAPQSLILNHMLLFLADISAGKHA